MVDSQIRTNGVITPGIIEAFRTVPREEFIPKTYRGMAYADEDAALGGGRFLLDPTVHARMIEAAELQENDAVLDIGCATGYSSAILSSLVMTVIALEESQEYLDRAAQMWARLGVNNAVGFKGTLSEGCPKHAPYSLIVINGAVAEIPTGIAAQLSPEGRLLAILRKPGEVMGQATIARNVGGRVSTFSLFSAAAPYVPGFEPKQAFVF